MLGLKVISFLKGKSTDSPYEELCAIFSSFRVHKSSNEITARDEHYKHIGTVTCTRVYPCPLFYIVDFEEMTLVLK